MKKLLLVGLTTAVLLAGCSSYNASTGQEINSELVDIGDLGADYDLIRDKNTGCIYIQEGMAHSYPLTPYFDEDGEVAGCGEKDLDKTKYE